VKRKKNTRDYHKIPRFSDGGSVEEERPESVVAPSTKETEYENRWPGQWRDSPPRKLISGVRRRAKENTEREGRDSSEPLSPRNEWTPDDSGTGYEGRSGIRFRRRT